MSWPASRHSMTLSKTVYAFWSCPNPSMNTWCMCYYMHKNLRPVRQLVFVRPSAPNLDPNKKCMATYLVV